jgi:hypothetical protein
MLDRPQAVVTIAAQEAEEKCQGVEALAEKLVLDLRVARDETAARAALVRFEPNIANYQQLIRYFNRLFSHDGAALNTRGGFQTRLIQSLLALNAELAQLLVRIPSMQPEVQNLVQRLQATGTE